MLYNDYLRSGGERQSVTTEVESLRGLGIDVHLHRVDNERLATASVVERVGSTFPQSAVRRSLEEEIRRFQPDIVHAQNIFPRLGASAIHALELTNIPWVRTLRNYRKGCIAGTFRRNGSSCTDCLGSLGRVPGVMHRCYRQSYVASLGATNYAFWETKAEARYAPDAYIFVSNAMSEILLPLLPLGTPSFVVHNAVKPRDVASPSRFSERKFDAVFVGRLSAEKGAHIAVEMAKEMPDQRFCFAGSGIESPVISAAIDSLDNSEFLGEISSPATAELMADAKVVLVPSQWEEPFGRVAVEALASGALPMVSGVGGLPEIVRPLDPQYIVASADPQVWSSRLMDIMETSAQGLEVASMKARDYWFRSFSPAQVGANLKGVYEEVLAGRRKSPADVSDI